MSYQEDRLAEIANAIRAKDGTSAPIKATDFAARIEAIPSGGVGTIQADVTLQYSIDEGSNWVQEDRLTEIANAIRAADGTTEPIKATDFADRILNIPIVVLSQHAYDKMEAHAETTTYHIIDPYGELDKIYVGNTLTWSKYPQNVVVFLSDEARTITPTYTQADVTLQYSIDEGSNWVTIASKTETESSKEIWFRGQATRLLSLYNGEDSNNAWAFSSPHTSLRVKGNLNYLLCDMLGDIDAPLATESYCYSDMFRGCTSLIEAPSLPATSLGANCYRNMFRGCTSLVEAPALPATSLGAGCYHGMFTACTSLIETPVLPATTLQSNCYNSMFNSCISLVEAPALPAITLEPYCYSYMFHGCTSLVESPALPAMTLQLNCYRNMFDKCTRLVDAPVLPATDLQPSCYRNMFSNCTRLVDAPALPATYVHSHCYFSMFENCTSLVKAPALPATLVSAYCYNSMFNNCTSLVEIKLGYTGTDTIFTGNWVNNIKTIGTLYKAGDLFDASGNSTYPTTWTQVRWTP